MQRNLQDILPILAVEHNCILSKMGDISIVYAVTLPEIFTLSDQQYEALHHTWMKTIKVFPDQTIFHKQDWFTQAGYEAKFSADSTLLCLAILFSAAQPSSCTSTTSAANTANTGC